MNNKWDIRRQRVFEIVEVGNDLDYASRAYDFFTVFAILINLAVSTMYTFDYFELNYGPLLLLIERITVATFCIDYILRVWTAKCLFPKLTPKKALRKYLFSFTGIVDLLSFLPYYLPIFFPAGAVAFRMLRIVRIFRLFKINAYYDSLNVITEVIAGKKQQLISSVFIIMVLILASSLCMYSLEHNAQPEVFSNAFSGVWWAASTLLTVGYGDIYPVTTMGRIFGMLITCLGVGMVAIPTGIISAGFVDQYSSIKKKIEYGYEADMRFIKIHLTEKDRWTGLPIFKLELPTNVIIAAIKRGEHVLIPKGDTILQTNDLVILGAEPFDEHEQIHIKEIILKKHNPWTNQRIRDIDISRHSIIVLVKRNDKVLIPNGNLILRESDNVFLYTKLHLANANDIEI